MKIQAKGSIDYYTQPFDFGRLVIKPKADKNYTAKGFQSIGVESVTEGNDGLLYLNLVQENYFDAIKAIDILSRLPEMEKVGGDKSNVVSIIPSSWEVSDETIVSLETDYNDYFTAIVRGLRPGRVTVGIDGINCEIIVK